MQKLPLRITQRSIQSSQGIRRTGLCVRSIALFAPRPNVLHLTVTVKRLARLQFRIRIVIQLSSCILAAESLSFVQLHLGYFILSVSIITVRILNQFLASTSSILGPFGIECIGGQHPGCWEFNWEGLISVHFMFSLYSRQLMRPTVYKFTKHMLPKSHFRK